MIYACLLLVGENTTIFKNQQKEKKQTLALENHH
jgi:hypothetical protein